MTSREEMQYYWRPEWDPSWAFLAVPVGKREGWLVALNGSKSHRIPLHEIWRRGELTLDQAFARLEPEGQAAWREQMDPLWDLDTGVPDDL